MCPPCAKQYEVIDGILIMKAEFNGPNAAAAGFYDGPLWQKFKFWERVFFWFQGGERRGRNQYMKHLPIKPGEMLGVSAIGAGNDLNFVPETCPVVGVDISVIQLKECLKRFPKRDLTLVLGEAERFPMPDRSVDHSLSAGGFNFFNEPIQSLREMVRITRPGGTIVVSDEMPETGAKAQQKPMAKKWVEKTFGDDFSKVVFDRGTLPLNDVFSAAFSNWKMHSLWRGSGYCAVATVMEADHEALKRPAPTVAGSPS